MAVRMTSTGCVVLLGDFSEERLPLATIGREFALRMFRATDLNDLESLCRWTTVSAVLVHAPTVRMHWIQALHQVKTLAPRARVVICHGVNDANAILDMTDAGAFHTLLVPLEHGEVRQSLGFISAAVGVAA